MKSPELLKPHREDYESEQDWLLAFGQCLINFNNQQMRAIDRTIGAKYRTQAPISQQKPADTIHDYAAKRPNFLARMRSGSIKDLMDI